jgi:hypothetical protein
VNHQDTKFIRESQEKNDEFFRDAQEFMKAYQNQVFRADFDKWHSPGRDINPF